MALALNGFRVAWPSVARPKKDPSDRKKTLSIRLDPDLYEWIEEVSGSGKEFHNRTHVIERALTRLREEKEGEG